MVRWPREYGVWLLVGALAVLLALLAALQYHWTGEIGRAEGERQRRRLERAAQRFDTELSRELGRVLRFFRPDFRGPAGDPRTAMLEGLERWRATEHGGLVSRLVVVTFSDSGEPVVEAAETGRGELERVPLPASLEPVSRSFAAFPEGRRPREGFEPRGLLDRPPSFLLPLVQPGEGGGARSRPGSFRLSGFAALELSEDYLSQVLLPELAEVHFGPLEGGDYIVAVLRRADDTTLYANEPGLEATDIERPDVRRALTTVAPWPGGPRGRDFLRGDPRTGNRGPRGRRGRPGGRAEPPEERPNEPPFPGRPGLHFPRGGEATGPWVLLVQHRGGSLVTAVETVRRRNLAVGLGILALLGTAAVVLAVGGQRARHLARQQLEFVAGVTHELHTPLAAIRSAGQNLRDGVVREPAQVVRYGDMIQKEGSRLTALVAQVLDFAGIESGSRAYASEPVALGPLGRKGVADLCLVLEQAGMTAEVDVADDLPELRGDAEALRRALENVLTNAVKFSKDGGWVGVRAASTTAGRAVELRIEDRGPGIPKSERARVFEPFYRGPGARESQAPGSGLGLSLVRHVAVAHGGGVRVEARDEGGTAIVIELPTDTREETT
jgi:signal transduction histidine kinase